jgi:hypothetical protein
VRIYTTLVHDRSTILYQTRMSESIRRKVISTSISVHARFSIAFRYLLIVAPPRILMLGTPLYLNRRPACCRGSSAHLAGLRPPSYLHRYDQVGGHPHLRRRTSFAFPSRIAFKPTHICRSYSSCTLLLCLRLPSPQGAFFRVVWQVRR